MKTAAIHTSFTAPDAYSWTAIATLRHLDPAKDNVEVQLSGTDRFADAYEAELVIAEKIARSLKDAFPGHDTGTIEIVRFRRASDGAL